MNTELFALQVLLWGSLSPPWEGTVYIYSTRSQRVL